MALYTVQPIQPVHCSLFIVVYSGRQGEMVCLIVILGGDRSRLSLPGIAVGISHLVVVADQGAPDVI